MANAPDFRGGYNGEATFAGGGGYDPFAPQNYTGRSAPDFRGGYYGEQIEPSGGGYDPYDPKNYKGAVAPSFAGGYYGDQVEPSGGGYDPLAPANYTGPVAPDFRGGYYGEQIEPSGGGHVTDLLDPTNARNAINGLPTDGVPPGAKGTPNIGIQGINESGFASATTDNDWRVRVSLNPGAKIFYQDPDLKPNALLRPLIETNGVIFPYTPTISMIHAAQYNSQGLTHSNYPVQTYNYSEVSDITITGDFTVQNASDGQYLMAVIYFFRSITKMFFGQGANVGMPPPVVFLDGYGSHYLPHVPCVLTSFNHNMPGDVDYVQVPVTQVATGRATNIATTTRLPTSSSISLTMRPVYSRKSLSDRFDLNKFAKGELLADRGTGAGGFL